jgi:hypothetical protein
VKCHKMTSNIASGEIPHGVRIKASDKLGEVLIATRDYCVGEVVISEMPVVLWSTNELELARKFMELSEERCHTPYSTPCSFTHHDE